MCHNTKFTRRSCTKGNIKSSAAGLRLGRKVDRAFSARVRGRANGDEQARVAGVFKALRGANIAVTGTQVPAAAYGIKTLADGVGVAGGAGGGKVVIELKCTTSSVAVHQQRYHVACSACPTIRVRHAAEPNSEYVRHQLQVGFAARALGWAKGVVVVSCTDGAMVYWLRPAFAAPHWFSVPHARSKPAKLAPSPAIAWPAATATPPSPVVSVVGRVAVLQHGSAVALRGPPSKLRPAQRRALAVTLAGSAAPHYLLYPSGSGWRVSNARWLGNVP